MLVAIQDVCCELGSTETQYVNHVPMPDSDVIENHATNESVVWEQIFWSRSQLRIVSPLLKSPEDRHEIVVVLQCV